MTHLGGIFGAKTDFNQTNGEESSAIKEYIFFLHPSLIHCHSTNSNGGIPPGKENFNCHLCPITWEAWGQDQISQHQTPTRCGIAPGTGSFILELLIWPWLEVEEVKVFDLH